MLPDPSSEQFMGPVSDEMVTVRYAKPQILGPKTQKPSFWHSRIIVYTPKTQLTKNPKTQGLPSLSVTVIYCYIRHAAHFFVKTVSINLLSNIDEDLSVSTDSEHCGVFRKKLEGSAFDSLTPRDRHVPYYLTGANIQGHYYSCGRSPIFRGGKNECLQYYRACHTLGRPSNSQRQCTIGGTSTHARHSYTVSYSGRGCLNPNVK
jgi:hypothetical protein